MNTTRAGCIIAATLTLMMATGLGDAQAVHLARKSQPVADKTRTETWPVCGLKTDLRGRPSPHHRGDRQAQMRRSPRTPCGRT